MMGMTPNEAELNDVESHYPTDRIPREMKEKSVAENLLDKMSETQSVLLSFTISFNQRIYEFLERTICCRTGSIFIRGGTLKCD